MGRSLSGQRCRGCLRNSNHARPGLCVEGELSEPIGVCEPPRVWQSRVHLPSQLLWALPGLPCTQVELLTPAPVKVAWLGNSILAGTIEGSRVCRVSPEFHLSGVLPEIRGSDQRHTGRRCGRLEADTGVSVRMDSSRTSKESFSGDPGLDLQISGRTVISQRGIS